MDKLKSRKFWLTVATAILTIANEGLGWNLPTDAIMQVVAVVIAYVLGQGAVDAVQVLRRE
jgi:uncharacterized membrane protein